MIKVIQRELEGLADLQRADILQRFFKSYPGGYGAGDIFRGIRVPTLRKLSKAYENISLNEIEQLISSPFHEDRLLALLILVRQYSKSDQITQSNIHMLYLTHRYRINNWDLVDASAEHMVGTYLFGKDKEPLYHMAQSNDLWERRIAIMSTFHFIKRGDFRETFNIAQILLADSEDLIHKAVGWMLREVGKRDMKSVEGFLKTYYQQMPRTMLRYAIEKFPEVQRQKYLKGEI